MHLRSIAVKLSAVTLLPLALVVHAQDDPARRGRKYKPPPETSHIEILVVKDANDKPIANAGIVFHTMRDGKDEGNLEVKSGPDGKGIIDIIPTGSLVDIQVIANGYSTKAEKVQINEATRNITIRMQRPKTQVSGYDGKSLSNTRGVQEPIRTGPKAAPSKPITSGDPVLKLAPPASDSPDNKTDSKPDSGQSAPKG